MSVKHQTKYTYHKVFECERWRPALFKNLPTPSLVPDTSIHELGIGHTQLF